MFKVNTFFKQDPSTLKKKRVEVENILVFKYGYSLNEKNVYLAAYDYFSLFKDKFNGASLSKDLIDVYGVTGYDDLDLDAMLHDYFDFMLNVSSSWKCVTIADRIFANGIEEKNKADKTFGYVIITNFYSWHKLKGLQLLRPFRVLRSLIKNGRMTKEQKEQFNEIINIFGCE